MESGLYGGICLIKSLVVPEQRDDVLKQIEVGIEPHETVYKLLLTEYERSGRSIESSFSQSLKMCKAYFEMGVSSLITAKSSADLHIAKKRFEDCIGKASEVTIHLNGDIEIEELMDKLFVTKYHILAILYITRYFETIDMTTSNMNITAELHHKNLTITKSRIRHVWKELVKCQDIMSYVVSDGKILRSSFSGKLSTLQVSQKIRREFVLQLSEMSILLNVMFGKGFKVNYLLKKYLTRLEEWILNPLDEDEEISKSPLTTPQKSIRSAALATARPSTRSSTASMRSTTSSQRLLKSSRNITDKNVYAIATYQEKLLFTAAENYIQVWDISSSSANPNLVDTLLGHTNIVRSLVVFGDRLYSASNDKTIRVWDIPTMSISSGISPPASPMSSAETDNSPSLVATLAAHKGYVHTLLISDSKLFSMSNDDTMKIWNLMKPAYQSGPPTCISNLSFDGEWIFSWAINGNLLLGSTTENTVKCWVMSVDLQSHTHVATLQGHEGPVRNMLVHDNKLYTGSIDETIRVWNVSSSANLSLLYTIRGNPSFITSLAISGGRLFAGLGDKSVKVWHIAANINLNDRHSQEFHHMMSFSGHQQCVYALHTTTDRLFSGSKDGLLKAWSITVLPSFRDVNLPRGYFLSDDISISRDMVSRLAPENVPYMNEEIDDSVESLSDDAIASSLQEDDMSIKDEEELDLLEQPETNQEVEIPVEVEITDEQDEKDSPMDEPVSENKYEQKPEPPKRIIAAPPKIIPRSVEPVKLTETLEETKLKLKKTENVVEEETPLVDDSPTSVLKQAAVAPRTAYKTVSTRSVADTVAKIATISEVRGYRSAKADIMDMMKQSKLKKNQDSDSDRNIADNANSSRSIGANDEKSNDEDTSQR